MASGQKQATVALVAEALRRHGAMDYTTIVAASGSEPASGQKQATVALVAEALRRHGAMDYTTIVAASGSEPASLQYLAAYSGCAMVPGRLCRMRNGRVLPRQGAACTHSL